MLHPNACLLYTSSIPLIICLLRRIYFGKGGRNYLFVFLYPLLSYFSYFGFFILTYLVLAILILWVRDSKRAKKNQEGGNVFKHLSVRLILALFLLAAGYILFEYRLFREMLFSDTVSMRVTMAEDNYSAGQIAATVWDVFTKAIFQMCIRDRHTGARRGRGPGSRANREAGPEYGGPGCLLYTSRCV